jgi:hypothetical protein
MQLHVEPRQIVTWREFLKEAPDYSIALDGYVEGPPHFMSRGDSAYKKGQMGPHANFNHHEGVDRLATRSTCEQVYVAIKQGFMDAFKPNGKVDGHIYVNDPDQDTCLAVWLLQNHERI